MKTESNKNSIVFERRYVKKVVVNEDNIRDPETLSEVIEQKCDIITKKSVNRPWLYLKESSTLKTIGGVRINKNTIGTFYLDTKVNYVLSETMVGVVSKVNENYVSNKITAEDIPALESVCDLINELMKDDKMFIGTRK